jgi:hypothetical protein
LREWWNIGAQKLMQFICIIHTNIHDISTNRKKVNLPQWAAAEAAWRYPALHLCRYRTQLPRENYMCLGYTTPGTPSHRFVNQAKHLPRHPRPSSRPPTRPG